MRKLLVLAVFVLLALTVITGCTLPSSASTATANPTPTSTPDIKQAQASPTAAQGTALASGNWLADGIVAGSEYAHSGTAGPLTVAWFNDDTYLYVALQARTGGWLSIGFDPDRTHAGADIIIGAMSSGKLELLDSYGTSERGAFHTPDTALGGTYDIIAAAGSVAGGVTTIEFQIPLTSGDAYDKALSAGEVGVILAVGSTANLTSMHSYATFGTIILDS